MSKDLGINTSKEDNISEWYQDVIINSELADYSEVSGCMVYRPLAYSIWSKIKEKVNERFKEIGIKNAYFPLFIPESLLEKEKEHFQGFNPEVAWVTEAGSSELNERLAVRPTSETIMYESYRDWIKSWRDLPLKLNQWNNVVRWEFKHPTPFLRTREFLWNEGHTVYETKEEALKDKEKILDIYKEVSENYMALPGVVGLKSEKEKFAGAINTWSIEYLLPDGKAVQGPDFHYDGTNFAEAFDITFNSREGEEKHPHQATFAITTRQLGIMIMVHSDDRGLIIPPRLAPTKTVIVPIPGGKKEEVHQIAEEIASRLNHCKIDDRENKTPGWKFNEWEMKGIPLRIEIGPNEVEEGTLTLSRRDTNEKTTIDQENLEKRVEEVLEDIQRNLLERAKNFLEENTREVENYEEFKKITNEKGGFIKAPWCGKESCENSIQDETTAKITNIPLKYDRPKEKKCVKCGKDAKYWAHFAKSY
ncbi:MAG: proline--tRNA ligase [Candidatus Hadarchaeia archaeon]